MLEYRRLFIILLGVTLIVIHGFAYQLKDDVLSNGSGRLYSAF